MTTRFLILLPILVVFQACTRTPSTSPPLLDEMMGAQVDAGRTSILIEKAKRQLSLKVDGKVVASCPVVLGFAPEGDKMEEGDGRTPEGMFQIRDKYPHAKWTYFIWVDYPTAESWRRFEERKRDGLLGDDAGIGGEIGIHGVPAGMDAWVEEGKDWTLGCISLRTEDIVRLYASVQVGTQVEIRP